MLEKKKILGVGITNATKEEILEYILEGLTKRGKKLFIITPNPEILVLAHKSKEYKKILNTADLALPDGIGVIIAGNVLGRGFKERITGVELLQDLCFCVAEKPITVGFLGGRPGVAEKTAECLVKKYPGLKVGFVGEKWEEDGSNFNVIKSKIKNQKSKIQLKVKSLDLKTKDQRLKTVDILFVAFGAPKQEIWISQNLDKLPVRVAIGVGGAFDYISGRVPRAPLFIRKIGFEWLFRLIIQPWRIKRQLALLEFTWLVLKEKFASRSSREGKD